MSISTKSLDPAWNYFETLNPKDKNTLKCRFCGKVTKGGICRAKQHLVGGYRNVRGCKLCPKHVRQEIKEFVEKKKSDKNKHDMELIDEFEIDEGHDDDELLVEPTTSEKRTNAFTNEAVSFKRPKQKGLLDVSSNPNLEVSARKHKGTQLKLNEMDRVCRILTKWMCDARIPFNAILYDSFKAFMEAMSQNGPGAYNFTDFVKAMSQYGLGMKPSIVYEVGVPFPKQEVENTCKVMEDHEQAWAEYGCSVLLDSWKDEREKTLINFSINSPKGSFFYKSVDASTYAKTSEKMFDLLSDIVQKIGVCNVIQVVTNSASNNVSVEKFLETKYPTLFWTPCVVHCINLMLEDIFKLLKLKETFDRAIIVNDYIDARPDLVSLLVKFTKIKELHRPTKAWFASAFITLGKMHKLKNNLINMFTSEEWMMSKWAKEAEGKKVVDMIFMRDFWNNVTLAFKVSNPLMCVLRLVNGETKSTMGYIYDAMDKVKEAIAAFFDWDERKHEAIFRIINTRWDVQRHHPLAAAGWYLNPKFFYNANKKIDSKVKKGLYECIRRLVPNLEIQNQIDSELSKYRNAEGLFGNYMAIRMRAKKAPAEWWIAYGDDAPALQNLAVRILSLPCSSSGCEYNWSGFENENTFEYPKSLMRFAKDLGPTVQTVAMSKMVEGVAETSTHQIAASSSRLQEWNTESDPTKFSFVNLLLGDGNGMDLTDVVVSSGSKMQKLVPSQSMREGSSGGERIDLMYEGNSHNLGGAHPQAMADGEGPRIGDNIEQEGLIWDCSKLNVSKWSSSSQAFGSVQGLASLYSGGSHQIPGSTDQSTVWGWYPIPDATGLSQGGNTELGGESFDWFKPTELGMEAIPCAADLSQGVNFKHGEQISSPWKPTEEELAPFTGTAGLSLGANIEFGEKSSNLFNPTEPCVEPSPYAAGLSQGANIEFGEQSSNWFKEPFPDAGPNHDGNIGDEGQVFDWHNSIECVLELTPVTAGPNYAGSFNHGGQSCNSFKQSELGLEFIPDAASPNDAGNINHGGQSSISFKPTGLGQELIAAVVSPCHEGSIMHGGQISDSFKSNETGLDLIPDAAGAKNAGSSSKHGGELSNRFKPAELGTEPNTDDWSQEAMRIWNQYESQAEPLLAQGWSISPCDEELMNTPHACDYER